MNYLSATELMQFGLDAAVPESLITAASALIDAHCRRPTLLLNQYTERVRVSNGVARLSYLPLLPAPFIVVKARYAPQRGEVVYQDDLVSLVAQTFALPGAWVQLDAATLDFDPRTGEVRLPPNALGMPFSEAEITYTAGLEAVPDAIKVACAQVVRNALATPALNVRASTLDRVHMEYFSDNLLDASVRDLLSPYVAQRFA